MSSSATASTVKRACDACHRRKVRCIGDGTKACKNCASSGLSCTYNAIPQKKGPKGSRAKVITELRQTQRLAGQSRNSPPEYPAFSRSSNTLPSELIDTCVSFFFAHLYPTQPVLDRNAVTDAVARMYDDVEAYVFVTALCAYMCIQPKLELSYKIHSVLDSSHSSATAVGQDLLQESTRVRKSIDWIEEPTIWSTITSFFFFGAYFSLDQHNLAWFHLREATTIAQLCGMHEEESYRNEDTATSSRKRRLYWLLFVTERAYAIQQHRPLTLHATIKLPTPDEDPSETAELNGFVHLVTLFRPFDDTFVGLWNKSRNGYPPGSWLQQLQQELSDALPIYLDSTETQAVDLHLSQAWLKTMVWQLSISHGTLSSLAADNAMSFKYPIEVSRDLLQAATQFSQQSMEVHGIGLVEKLFGTLLPVSFTCRTCRFGMELDFTPGQIDCFKLWRSTEPKSMSKFGTPAVHQRDVACTLTDVISCVPHEQYTFGFGPRDYLSQIVQLISKLRGQQRYMPLIMSKIGETMPNNPFTLSLVPESASSRVSEGHTSAAESVDSTPFGSPPLSAVSSHGAVFGQFGPGLGPAVAPTPPGLSNVVMTSGLDYDDLVATAPMGMFHHRDLYSQQEPRYDPDG